MKKVSKEFRAGIICFIRVSPVLEKKSASITIWKARLGMRMHFSRDNRKNRYSYTMPIKKNRKLSTYLQRTKNFQFFCTRRSKNKPRANKIFLKLLVFSTIDSNGSLRWKKVYECPNETCTLIGWARSRDMAFIFFYGYLAAFIDFLSFLELSLNTIKV